MQSGIHYRAGHGPPIVSHQGNFPYIGHTAQPIVGTTINPMGKSQGPFPSVGYTGQQTPAVAFRGHHASKFLDRPNKAKHAVVPEGLCVAIPSQTWAQANCTSNVGRAAKDTPRFDIITNPSYGGRTDRWQQGSEQLVVGQTHFISGSQNEETSVFFQSSTSRMQGVSLSEIWLGDREMRYSNDPVFAGSELSYINFRILLYGFPVHHAFLSLTGPGGNHISRVELAVVIAEEIKRYFKTQPQREKIKYVRLQTRSSAEVKLRRRGDCLRLVRVFSPAGDDNWQVELVHVVETSGPRLPAKS